MKLEPKSGTMEGFTAVLDLDPWLLTAERMAKAQHDFDGEIAWSKITLEWSYIHNAFTIKADFYEVPEKREIRIKQGYVVNPTAIMEVRDEASPEIPLDEPTLLSLLRDRFRKT
jgi:hypothetical protein